MTTPKTDRERIAWLEAEVAELRRDIWSMKQVSDHGVSGSTSDVVAIEKIRAALKSGAKQRGTPYYNPGVARLALLMMRHPGAYISADRICEEISRGDAEVANPMALVRVRLSHLRVVLADQGFPAAIQVKYGGGWAMSATAAGWLAGVLADD